MNDIRNDKNLQEAVKRREQQLEPMPTDLNERLMESLNPRPLQRERKLKHKWIYGAIAIAAGIALLIAFNFGKPQTPQEPLMTQQKTAEPLVALSQPVDDEQLQQQALTTEQPEQQQAEDPTAEAEPQAAEAAASEQPERQHHYNPQPIPDISSPRDEMLLTSTSGMPTSRRYQDGLATHADSEDSEDDGLNLTAAKDKDGVPEGWNDLKSWSNGQSPRHDLTKKERRQMAVLGAIADKRWHIDIQSMNTMRYGARSVTPDFFLELRGDTLRSNLPYLGQAQVSPLLSPTIGLNFEERVRQYQESRPKGKYTQIDIDVKTKEDTYHYVIDIYDSGEAYIRVRSLNRDPISFDGTLEMMQPKTDWKDIDIDSFEGIDGNKGVMQEPRWRVIPLDTKRTIGAV